MVTPINLFRGSRDAEDPSEVRRKYFRTSVYTSAPQSLDEVSFYRGLLASGPRQFRGMNDVVQVPFDRLEAILGARGLDVDFTMTNRGVRIRFPIQLLNEELKIYAAFLACGCESSGEFTIFAIYLRKISDTLYTRVHPHAGKQSDLFEIPIKTINPSYIGASDFVFVAVYDKPLALGARRICIPLKHLCTAFQKWGFTLFGRSWDSELNPESFINVYYSTNAEQNRGWQETFLIVKNEFKKVELMLVLRSDMIMDGSRPIHYVGIRAIPLSGSNELCAVAADAPSARHIYDAWREKAEIHSLANLLDWSYSATTTTSNGQEIKFMVTRAAQQPFVNADEWRLSVVSRNPQKSGSSKQNDS